MLPLQFALSTFDPFSGPQHTPSIPPPYGPHCTSRGAACWLGPSIWPTGSPRRVTFDHAQRLCAASSHTLTLWAR